MAIKADIQALKDSVRARINDNEEQDITAADVRESVIDTIDTLHEETERDFQKKEAGKGLSKNDYTDEDKEKVDGSIQKIIHNGEAVPVVNGAARINTVTTSDVDSKISYAINNEARERQAMDTRFRQEIGDPNALQTEAKQLVPAINEVLRKSGGDSYTKVEADERFATKEELEATHVLIPYIDEYSTDAELSAALDIIRGAEEGANMLCETEMFSGRYAVVTSLETNPMGVSFRYISEEEYIKKQIDMAPLGAGRRQYICSVTVTPIGGGEPVDAYTKEETDELLSGKQPTITDLAIIRSGASAGATAVQPTALNSYAKKEDVDKIVINLPFVDDESTQATLKQAYGKVIANPNAVFRIDNGILATAFVDGLNQVNLQYREGNEVVQMVIADNVGTYVLARDVVALADADDVVDIETDQNIKGEKTFQNGLVSDFANISDGKGHTLKSELTALQTEVGDLSNLETEAKDSLVDAINEVKQGGGGIPEAPKDGKTYGRKDGAWAEVQGGGESGKYGVISQTQTWTSDKSGYTMTNLVYGTIPQANLELFLSAGALFNDTANAIERTAPWGEQVQHLPGYFYLNGLGDISYDEIKNCFAFTPNFRTISSNNGTSVDASWAFSKVPFGTIRTNFVTAYDQAYINGINQQGGSISIAGIMNRGGIEVLCLPNSSYKNTTEFAYGGDGCIAVAGDITAKTIVEISKRLKYINLRGLSANITFSACSFLANISILYMIKNSAATSAITITLHADAYARAMADAEIQSALEAHPFVSLASA